MKREKQLKVMFGCTVLFVSAAMWTIFSFAAANGDVLSRAGTAEAGRVNQSAGGAGMYAETVSAYGKSLYSKEIREETLAVQLMAGEEGLKIPFPPELTQEDILTENHYETQDILMAFPGDHKNFFADSMLSGNPDIIEGVFLSEQAGSTWLRIRTNGIYEFEYDIGDKMAELVFAKPSALYDRIVLLDGGYAGEGDAGSAVLSCRKAFVQDIMGRVRAELEAGNIRVYCSGMEGAGLTEEERADLAEMLRADLTIGIRAAGWEETEMQISILYNGTYFIPGLGNARLAVLLEKYLGGSLHEENGDSLFLEKVRTPAAVIMIEGGDEKVLEDELCRQKTAEAVADAVMEAYAVMQAP